MFVPLLRPLILFLCTTSTFVVLGRAPGAVNLRTRDIETAISAEGRPGRDKKLTPALLTHYLARANVPDT